ncbi:putative siderophore-dependent iron transporter [Myriangium duriaei CBS 260.36]|uniref:Siderophore-dependent iron transporter n=1 Tax=Myriangium duriaei CBS 260.36 TaxID=1168546 RepID=A0A9P4J9Q5_9PEZI|nr:putative siderophore-dependent iron transporter [Myriangium duriaei CBS 260.36]
MDDPRSPSSPPRSSTASPQAGVRRLEVIASTWSKSSLLTAYLGLYLMAYVTSLEGQVTLNLAVFATSAFRAHSLIATVLVVQAVVLSVVKPPMAKIADVFGRFEAFSVCVCLFTIGYIMEAGANNVKTYAASAIFYSAGQTGLQILQQIFVADTSDLLNRALVSTIPNLPYLVNVWIGAPIASAILTGPGWRWGYGIWAIILPASYIPLAVSLYINQRKAARRGSLPSGPYAGKSGKLVAKSVWYELDFFGLLLLSAAIALILIPLTLAKSAKDGWQNTSIIAMLIAGAVCLVAFPLWERSPRLAPHAFFPPHLFDNRTVLAGVAIAFFYFMAYYLSVFPYFQSYLLVVQCKSVTTAGHIVQTFTFAATVTSIIVSFIIKFTKHYRYFVTLGACLYFLGIAVMIKYRSEGATIRSLVGGQVLLGVGGAMIHVPAQLGVQASASHQDVAAATAVFLTILEIGGAVGSSISGAIWTNNVLPKLEMYLPDETKDQAAAIFGNITLAANGWPMGDPTRQAINRAYQETMTKMLAVAVCVSLPLIPLSFLMKNYKLDEMNQHVRGTVIGGRRESAGPHEREPFVRTGSFSSHYEEIDTSPQGQRTLRGQSSRTKLL